MTSKWVILAQYNLHFSFLYDTWLVHFQCNSGKEEWFSTTVSKQKPTTGLWISGVHKPPALRIDLNIRSHYSCSANFCHNGSCKVMLLFGQPLFFLLTPMFLPKNTLSECTVRSDSLTPWPQAKIHSPIYPTQQSQVRKYQVEQIWMASHVCMTPQIFSAYVHPEKGRKRQRLLYSSIISMNTLMLRLILS